jgi:hypothetical protein
MSLHEWEKLNLVPVPVYVNMLLNTRICLLLTVKFSLARRVQNLLQHRSVLKLHNVHVEANILSLSA